MNHVALAGLAPLFGPEALGEEDEQGRWQIRLWWKPFVTLIWFGGIMVALGGLLSLIGRLRRERKIAPKVETDAPVEPEKVPA